MNLHFHPILIIDHRDYISPSNIKNATWSVEIEGRGKYKFDISGMSDPFESTGPLYYFGYDLQKNDVPFLHDDKPCEFIFEATLDIPISSPIEIHERFPGILKACWRKGLK